MRDNPLKKKFAAGGKAYGCWLQVNHPIAAEIAARAGYDFILIDHEHGPGDLMGAIALMNAAAAHGADGGPASVIRVPWNDLVYIKRALDIGAEAIMIPMVETAEQARVAVEACKYPPRGVRGSALGAIRATGYGADNTAYWERANDNLMTILQIETPKAVENIAEIADVEGVDVLFIGPGDLTASSGYDVNRPPEEAVTLIDRAAASVKECGKLLGMVPFAGRDATTLFGMGYDMVAGGSDVGHLRRALTADVQAVKEYLRHN